MKSSSILPADEKTAVCIFPENENFPSDMATIGAGKIIVHYERFDHYFKPGMAHEYHHSVWLGKHLAEKEFLTGLDHVVLEGEAVMFETLVYPNLNHMHALLDESFNSDHWSKLEPYLDSVAGEEILEMKIGGANGLPTSYDYSEGYKIVRSYLELHPEITVEEWTFADPKEIYEEVNYIANYR
ncbi:DUF2268 domain-containing putative Zn-dependent protease [Sporosarcina cascadiensis]|uniref:DUF2268 domain-containing putative Zn-dependent protease n=1 Tax=Sporosarcina cascadiensis TaxID=2660747 RepID=UPI0018918D55|nr:DUF2268 domain-containing putative Zn-dependent protease [Sporosarcina cascadiensis]